MSEVLIVEDCEIIANLLSKRIQNELGFEVKRVATYADTEDLLNNDNTSFFVAVVCLDLPDAPQGAIVDLLISEGIPSIVFTSETDNSVRDSLWTKRIVDFVHKEHAHNLDYVISLVQRIERNKNIHVLVVDDSQLFQAYMSDLLRIHRYTVSVAGDGLEALEIMRSHLGISLVITDSNMPNMDGLELTRKLRKERGKSELAIMGISSMGDNHLSVQFIKNGANDFIAKPFTSEQLYCRVSMNADMLEQMQSMREASYRDYLTGMYNRRFLFEMGRKMHADAMRGNTRIVVTIMDIDHFKRVNDTYGHDIGDRMLRYVAGVIGKRFRTSDLTARLGGEEFCVIAANMDPNQAYHVFDQVREELASKPLHYNDTDINVTISIGVCCRMMDSLDAMLNAADALLYSAKKAGRNRIAVTDETQESLPVHSGTHNLFDSSYCL